MEGLLVSWSSEDSVGWSSGRAIVLRVLLVAERPPCPAGCRTSSVSAWCCTSRQCRITAVQVGCPPVGVICCVPDGVCSVELKR